MKNTNDYNHIYDLCKDHMHSYVLAEMVDGEKIDGIITGLDSNYVYFAVPVESEEQSNRSDHHDESSDRQFGYGHGYGQGHGYGYGQGYGHGYNNYGYSHGYNPPNRFRRMILPLTALAALSILPWY